MNIEPSRGERLQLWVGTKTFIPMLKVDQTPGFVAVAEDLSQVDADSSSVKAADLSSLRLPEDLVCGGSYLVAVMVDEVL